MRIRVLRQSLLHTAADAIVNAANPAMRGGGGIDGLIHATAGPEMLRELQRIAPQGATVAEVMVTPGYGLNQPFVLHVAGPVWRGGDYAEDALLAATYRNALRKADALRCRTVAFCSISTGADGFPIYRAAPIAIQTISATLPRLRNTQEVVFAMFGKDEFEAFSEALAAPT